MTRLYVRKVKKTAAKIKCKLCPRLTANLGCVCRRCLLVMEKELAESKKTLSDLILENA